MTDIYLRPEREADWAAMEAVGREAFWNLHVPGCGEHDLLHVMRASTSFIRELVSMRTPMESWKGRDAS